MFATTNTILAIAKVAQNSIGIVSEAGTFANSTLTDYSNDYYFTQHSGAVWLQVSTIMSDYKKDKGDDFLAVRSGLLTSPTVAFASHNLVQNYARLRSLQQIDLIIQTALTAKQAQKVTADGSPGAPPAGAKKEMLPRRISRSETAVVPSGAPVYTVRPAR